MSELLTQMRAGLTARHYSRRTEEAYCQWVRRYVRFHRLRHPPTSETRYARCGRQTSGQVAECYTPSTLHGRFDIGGPKVKRLPVRRKSSLALLLLPLALCLASPGLAMAGLNSWTTAGPYGGGARGLAVSPSFSTDNTVFVGTQSGRVLKSTNRGADWTDVSASLHLVEASPIVSPAYASDNTLFAVGNSNSHPVYRSTTGGQKWTVVGSFDSPIWTGAFSPTYATDHTVFLAGDEGVFMSIDRGATWTAVNTGLTSRDVACLVLSPTFSTDRTLFVGTYSGGLFKSTNGGASWTAMNAGLTGKAVVALAVSPSYAGDHTLFAATDTDVSILGSTGGGLFKSYSGGASWTELNPGLATFRVGALAISPAFATDQTLFLGTTADGVLRSTTGGASWSQVNSGASNPYILSFAISPDYSNDHTLFMGSRGGGGVFKSTSSGESWTAVNSGIGFPTASLAVSPAFAADQTLFGGSWEYGNVFRSTTGGTAWEDVSAGLPANEFFRGSHPELYCLALSPGFANDHTLFVGTDRRGIFKSTSGGTSWTSASNGLPSVPVYPFLTVTSLAASPGFADDQTVLAGLGAQGVYRSVDGGTNWTSTSSGLAGRDVEYVAVSPAFTSDHTVFAGTDSGVFKSTSSGASWARAGDGLTDEWVSSLAISPDFAADRTLFAASFGGGVFKSPDGGRTWNRVNRGLSDLRAVSIVLSPAFAANHSVFVATGSGVFKSTDGGLSWTGMNTGLIGPEIGFLAVAPPSADGGLVFGASWAGGVYSFTVGPTLTKSTTTRLAAPRTAKVRKSLRLTGTVSPSAAPGSVRIVRSRLIGTSWRSAGSVTVSVRAGQFAYTFKPRARGKWRFVAKYAGGSVGNTTYRRSVSASKLVIVK